MRFEVQNAEAMDSPPTGPEWIMEAKLDGARILAHVQHAKPDSPGQVTFYTRTGKVHSDKKLVSIAYELANTFPDESWVDGELVCFSFNGDLVSCEWGVVQTVLGSKNPVPEGDRLSFIIFDVLALEDHDARSLPFEQRRQLLEKIFDGSGTQKIGIVPQLTCNQENHDALVATGWEGSIVKNLKSPYRSGHRGNGWGKIKAAWDVDAIITGFEPGKNGFIGMVGAIQFSQIDPQTKKLVKRGKCSGMDMKLRQDMTAHPDKYLGQVITVAHNGITKDGNLRHPQYQRLRPDKDYREVTLHDK